MYHDNFEPLEEINNFEPEYNDNGKKILDKKGKFLPKGSIESSRRKILENTITKDIGTSDFEVKLMAVFNDDPEAEDLKTALELVYDIVLDNLEYSANKDSEESYEWLKVANALIDLNENALMESVSSLIMKPKGTPIRYALSELYGDFLSTAKNDYRKQCNIFIKIATALASIVEKISMENPQMIEVFKDIKEELDAKYGPMYKGMEDQLHEIVNNNRRYGRLKNKYA